MRRRAASSSSWGRFVAPMRRSLSLGSVAAPSSCTRNSVLTRRVESWSPSERWQSSESISSTKITAGRWPRATVKSARTIFSASPIHLDMSDEAEMEKKVAPDSVAMALPISVLPVPGGPKRRRPLDGWRSPVKRSGRWIGQTTASMTDCLANSKPATSSQLTPGDVSSTSLRIISTILGSTPLYCSSPSPPLSASSASVRGWSWRPRGACASPFLAPCATSSPDRDAGRRLPGSWGSPSLGGERLCPDFLGGSPSFAAAVWKCTFWPAWSTSPLWSSSTLTALALVPRSGLPGSRRRSPPWSVRCAAGGGCSRAVACPRPPSRPRAD